MSEVGDGAEELETAGDDALTSKGEEDMRTTGGGEEAKNCREKEDKERGVKTKTRWLERWGGLPERGM